MEMHAERVQLLSMTCVSWRILSQVFPSGWEEVEFLEVTLSFSPPSRIRNLHLTIPPLTLPHSLTLSHPKAVCCVDFVTYHEVEREYHEVEREKRTARLASL